jgi:hypothetical protein
MPGGRIAGAVAGYAGGGTFVVERFYAKHQGGKLSSLWMDQTDRISQKEIDFERCGADVLAICESALDAIWQWNDNEVWCDTDEVILQSARTASLKAEGEMLFLATDQSSTVSVICKLAGLNSCPKNK